MLLPPLLWQICCPFSKPRVKTQSVATSEMRPGEPWVCEGEAIFEETRTTYYHFSSKIHINPEKIKIIALPTQKNKINCGSHQVCIQNELHTENNIRVPKTITHFPDTKIPHTTLTQMQSFLLTTKNAIPSEFRHIISLCEILLINVRIFIGKSPPNLSLSRCQIDEVHLWMTANVL
jgi:hypothetical protein